MARRRSARKIEQGLVVLADRLDQQVVRAGGDDDVVDLGHLGQVLGHLDELGALAADADHRHLVEAELERIGDADDLEDPALDQPVRPGADGRLGDAELGGDLGERPAAVGLEVLDDPLVERRDLVGARPRRGRDLALGARWQAHGPAC